MNNYRVKISSFFFTIFLLFFISIPAALANQDFFDSLDKTAEGTGHFENTSTKSIPGVIAMVIKTLLGVVGMVFLVLIIYAGYTWLMARGNEAEVQKAKEIIYRSIVGLIIILGAYAITNFIGGKIK